VLTLSSTGQDNSPSNEVQKEDPEPEVSLDKMRELNSEVKSLKKEIEDKTMELNSQITSLKKQLDIKTKLSENLKENADTMKKFYLETKKKNTELERQLRKIEKTHISPKDYIVRVKEEFKGTLTSNQVDLITQRKKSVTWTIEEY
jgi:septal ring factor EnvC (AmiA/AmiB activator)